MSDTALTISRHECAHALRAHACSFTLKRISLPEAVTIVNWGITQPEMLDLAKANPALATRTITNIASTLLAGALCEGLLIEQASIDDARILNRWSIFWPKAIKPWRQVLADATVKTKSWLALPSTKHQLHKLAIHLMAWQELDGAAVEDFLGALTPQRTPAPVKAVVPVRTAAQKALENFDAFYRFV